MLGKIFSAQKLKPGEVSLSPRHCKFMGALAVKAHGTGIRIRQRFRPVRGIVHLGEFGLEEGELRHGLLAKV